MPDQTPFVVVIASGVRIAIGGPEPECELHITEPTARLLLTELSHALGLIEGAAR